MVAEHEDSTQTYADQLREEVLFLERQLERAQRKEATWSARRQMLESTLQRTHEELERMQ